MTAKEKALELYRKFEGGITGVEGADWWKSAEQCALIAVDEVLQYSKAHGFIELTEYYQEVKKEIQNI